jgi:quinolinate synthase
LRQAAPGRTFYAAREEATCRFMKMITLDKIRKSLEEGIYEINVPRETAGRARLAIERMLSLA